MLGSDHQQAGRGVESRADPGIFGAPPGSPFRGQAAAGGDGAAASRQPESFRLILGLEEARSTRGAKLAGVHGSNPGERGDSSFADHSVRTPVSQMLQVANSDNSPRGQTPGLRFPPCRVSFLFDVSGPRLTP